MFSKWFSSWCCGESESRGGLRRVLRRRVPGKGWTRTALRVEELEPRVVPTTTSIGSLVGRAYFSGHAAANRDNGDIYHFDISPQDPLVSSEQLDVQISSRDAFGGTANLDLISDSAVLTDDSSIGATIGFQGKDPPDGDYASSLSDSVSAGPWTATVSGGVDYRLALATDPAGGDLSSESGYPIASAGLFLGTLTTDAPKSAVDFIGYLDTSAHPGKDLIDSYEFNVPASGTVGITLDQLAQDPAGGAVAADLQLFHNVDNGLYLEPGESLAIKTARVGQSAQITGTLAPGIYDVVVSWHQTPPSDTLLGGSNYRLRVSYTAPDSAGNTLAAARDISGVGTSGLPLADYLSAGDTTDFYKFSVSGGPFIFNAQMDAGPVPFSTVQPLNLEFDIVRDANHNGKVDLDSNEILAVGTNDSGHDNIFADAQDSDTYYVRVRRVEGEGPYTLKVFVRNTDLAGNTLATANNIGNLFGRTEFVDAVSSFDPNDIYKFSMTAQGTITASFPSTGSGSDPDLQLIQDADGDGAIDSRDILVSGTHLSQGGVSLSRTVPAGTYYLNVKWVAQTPTYDLTLTADTAGGSPRQARSMGLSGDAAETQEFVGPGDAADFYALSIPSPLQLNILFTALVGDPVVLSVIGDANGNNVIDPGETLLQKTIATSADLRQTVNVVTHGETVFVKVAPAGANGTNYGILFATAPVDNAGNSPAEARNLGELGANRTFRDFVGDGSIDVTARGDPILGVDDVDDYYRFTLGNNGPYAFSATISGLTGNADLQLSRDVLPSTRVDGGKLLATSNNTGTASDSIGLTLDRPGVYYLRVFRPGNGTTGSANYTLNLSALQPPNTDNPGNSLQTAKSLGLLTTSAPLSASEFVGAIDRDDFYVFTVQAAGILTVTRNATKSGIPFEVIQDADFDFVIDPPPANEILATTGDTLNLAGSTKLTVSLPAAGFYYVHVASTGIDSNYTLTLSFSNTVGSFVLSAPNAAVDAGEHVSLGLQWTVPQGSWHGLHDVQLRIRDAFGTLALVKFNEAENSLSLFDPDTGEFGPAKVVGSAGVLANRYVTIFLRTTSVTAAGPNSPTVTLTLDIVFKESASGRRLFLEAAASDDLGHSQDFAIGGILNVLDPGSRKQRPA